MRLDHSIRQGEVRAVGPPLDDGLVRRYLAAIRAEGDGERALKARGLVVERAGELVPTVAGMLILGSEPQAHFPEAYVRLRQGRPGRRRDGRGRDARPGVGVLCSDQAAQPRVLGSQALDLAPEVGVRRVAPRAGLVALVRAGRSATAMRSLE